MQGAGYVNIDDIRRSRLLVEQLRTAEGVKRKHHRNRQNAVYCPSCGDAGAEYFESTKNPGVWMVKCWACGICWDYVGWYQHEHRITSRLDAVMEITGQGDGNTTTRANVETVSTLPTVKITEEAEELETVTDFSSWFSEVADYCRRCRSALTPGSMGARWMASRGFADVGFLRRYGCGFDPEATGHGSLTFPRPALVMPYDGDMSYYTARIIGSGDKRSRFTKPKNKHYPAGWRAPVFHAGQLHRGFDSVFVTEGEIDALSINYAADAYGLNVGAVATAGAANWPALVKALEDSPTDSELFIAFDADKAGRENSIGLSEALEEIGVDHRIIDMDSMMFSHGWVYRGEPANDVNDVLSRFGVEAMVSFITSAPEMVTYRAGLLY